MTKNHLKEIKKGRGCISVPEMQLFEETVEKDVSFGPRNLNIPEEDVKERVRML